VRELGWDYTSSEYDSFSDVLKMEINFGILQKEAISSYLPRKYPVSGNKFYVHIYIYKRELWGKKINEDSLPFLLVYFKVLLTHPKLN
jgi:hypothetical protein